MPTSQISGYHQLDNPNQNERKLQFANQNMLISTLMQHLIEPSDTGSNNQTFLSPKQTPDGLYVTSPATLNKYSDPRDFLETQIKRCLNGLSTKPPVLNSLFNWLFFDKMKMKLSYYSEHEDLTPDEIYQSGYAHQIEPFVTNGFKMHNLGHATQLIQTEGVNILTDPAFGHLHFLNVKIMNRDVNPIGYTFYPSMTNQFGHDIQPENLPHIDYIMISHNHRDHVDEPSLRWFIEHGLQPTLYVPKGDKVYFESLGFTSVIEFEWHDEISVLSKKTNKEVTFCCAPANHRSGRIGADAHKSLVSGWVISPKSRDEILYFAGDTAKLDDVRLLSLALDIYSLYKQKNGKSEVDQLPKIISMVPGGPNYTRKDMEPTHQSAVDSVLVAFRLALALEKISQQDGKPKTAKQWLEATATIFMHHNRFQLGPDRFNENIFVFNRLLSYLEMDEDRLQTHLEKQNRKSTFWSLFEHRKDFIITGAKELKLVAKKIWPDNSSDSVNELVGFIKARTHFPLINQKVSVGEAFSSQESTIKPNTKKGFKKIGL